MREIHLVPPPAARVLSTYGYLADGSPADDGPAYWVLVYDADGPRHLYRNRCPHTGAPMEWQPHTFLDFDGELILCALHGARFSPTTGHCLGGPCKGRDLQRVAFSVTDDGHLAVAAPEDCAAGEKKRPA